MKPCRICHKSFIPRQTFETLFTPETVCQSCTLSLKRELAENHIPLTNADLMILTFEAPMNDAFFHTLMKRILNEKLTMIFYDAIALHNPTIYSHLKTLLNPLILFHSDFVTLNKLETLEAMLEEIEI